MTTPSQIPTSYDLIVAVRDFLQTSLLENCGEHQRYQIRVAINVLEIVGREIRFGADAKSAHQRRLASLGFADDDALAAAIKSGSADDRLQAVMRVLAESTEERLSITNPGYHRGPADERSPNEDQGDV